MISILFVCVAILAILILFLYILIRYLENYVYELQKAVNIPKEERIFIEEKEEIDDIKVEVKIINNIPPVITGTTTLHNLNENINELCVIKTFDDCYIKNAAFDTKNIKEAKVFNNSEEAERYAKKHKIIIIELCGVEND